VSFHLTNRQGASQENPSIEIIERVLGDLDGVDDAEHPDVSLSHESGWTLSAFPSGLVVWENVECETEPRHRRGVSRPEVRRLWLLLAGGDIASVDAYTWDQGYGADPNTQG
jgi:hypothetical protein